MKFDIAKKGYDTKQVDEYISRTEAALDEFRKREDMISKSIIIAEAEKSRIIKEAEEKARKIISDTNDEVAEQVQAIRKMLECEKKALADFCAEYDDIVKTYFTAGASEITSPLKEKLLMIEYILDEQKNPPADEGEETGNTGNGSDPFGEIRNYF